MVQDFNRSGYTSMGILCKTQTQAKKLSDFLQKNNEKVHLLTPGSSSMSSAVIIACVHLAKGLEFDRVIVLHVDSANYETEVDRSMLYIAGTRAMHQLTLTHSGDVTSLINYR